MLEVFCGEARRAGLFGMCGEVGGLKLGRAGVRAVR
jgi:hypothetical protein